MAYPPDNEVEKASFIRGNPSRRKEEYNETEKSGCCSRCCTLKCCCFTCLGITLAALLVGGGLFLYVQNLPDKTEDAALWESRLAESNYAGENFSVDGNYTLVSYDDNYSTYLKSMGIPWFVVPLILASSEQLKVKITQEGAEITTVTDWMERTTNFEFNQIFNMTYGKGIG